MNELIYQLTLVQQIRNTIVNIVLFAARGHVSGYDVALQRGQVEEIVAERDEYLTAFRTELGVVELLDEPVVLWMLDAQRQDLR